MESLIWQPLQETNTTLQRLHQSLSNSQQPISLSHTRFNIVQLQALNELNVSDWVTTLQLIVFEHSPHLLPSPSLYKNSLPISLSSVLSSLSTLQLIFHIFSYSADEWINLLHSNINTFQNFHAAASALLSSNPPSPSLHSHLSCWLCFRGSCTPC